MSCYRHIEELYNNLLTTALIIFQTGIVGFDFFQTRLAKGKVWKGNVATFHVVLDPPAVLTHIGNHEYIYFRLNINIFLAIPLIRSLSFLS